MPYHIIYNDQRTSPRITEKLAPDPPVTDPPAIDQAEPSSQPDLVEEKQTDEVIIAETVDVTGKESGEPGEITIKVLSMPPAIVDEPEPAAANEPEGLPAMEPHKRSYRQPLLAGALVLAITLVLAVGLVFTPLLSWLTPLKATITLTPARDSSTIVRTVPIAQLDGHQLAPVSVTASATTATTGVGQHPATAAVGQILLYNGTTVAQTVLAGTRIVGRSGIVISTSVTRTVPAAILPTEGEISVPGQALAAGPGGNISAGNLRGAPVQAGVVADNGQFSGGAAAYTYQAVSASDIARLVAQLKTSLLQQAGQQIQAQLAGGEASTAPSCSYQQQASAAAGDEANQVTVRETATCQALAYSSSALQTLAATWLARPGYALAAAPQIAVAVVKGLAQVTLAATWIYQWSKGEIARLRGALAGKTKAQALDILRGRPGVANAVLRLNKDNQNVLPTDPGNIAILVA